MSDTVSVQTGSLPVSAATAGSVLGAKHTSTSESKASALYVGLMSGTSLDGVDGVLADFGGGVLHVLAYAAQPLPRPLKAELLALNTPNGFDEIHRSALAANALVAVYAQVVNDLLAQAKLPASAVQAIGVHGQTVRHRPGEFDGVGYTIQLNNPALLAEQTGIDVVADFRSRDVAAGGQGAPLVPAFHQSVFGGIQAVVMVANIGGMANLSVLGATQGLVGFDCGPGNALMDYWCQRHTGQAFDDQGAWAASGQVIESLLQALLQEPFFSQAAPKSTGRDLFNSQWLASYLESYPTARPQDVQATLVELTAKAVAASATSYGNSSKKDGVANLLLVCGGGALNHHLLARLQNALPGWRIASSAQHGLPPLQVEAAAFAWLARSALARVASNSPSVTGARGARVLGAIYPA